jgi:hypothetical protein
MDENVLMVAIEGRCSIWHRAASSPNKGSSPYVAVVYSRWIIVVGRGPPRRDCARCATVDMVAVGGCQGGGGP